MATLDVTSGNTPKGGSNDPFVSTPTSFNAAQLRYATLDNDQFTSYSANSPAQARRALEAHLKETDRRIHDAAKLGNTLIEQKKNLAARLADIENIKTDDEVPANLRQKLADLEKEYNEVGRESARAFLPKLKPSKSDANTLSGQGASSPSKVLAPSRRQRNTPNARVHDIEFATEISTSLLAQVRQLQAALAEKDETLKETATVKAQLETDVAGLSQRVKQMDERTQQFKDENWTLETKIQELEGSLKQSLDDHQRLNQSWKASQQEKASAHRDLDDLKLTHDKALEAHSEAKRQLDNDLHSLRRDVANHEADKQLLQKKIDDLESNNTELARAVSYRFNQPGEAKDSQRDLADSDNEHDYTTMQGGDISPIKGTPARPGMLESETLKSSLTHAHRTIQTLKNTLNREKSEKMDLRRMLNEARDELEKKRNDPLNPSATDKKKRGVDRDGRSRRAPRLGAAGAATTEILDDEPEWEEHDGARTPTRRVFSAAMPGAFVSANTTDAESTDAFETADERGDAATETEGFQTGAESLGDESDELTETETGPNRSRVIRPSVVAGERRSYLSTASTSTDEDEDPRSIRTPSQSVGPKYRLRNSKSARRSLRTSQILADSPASNMSTPQNVSQTLGDELAGLDDDSIEGTPSKIRDEQLSALASSPETQRTVSTAATPVRVSPFTNAPLLGHQSAGSSPVQDVDQTVLVHEFTPKPAMIDAGIMTEPWEPEQQQSAGATLLADDGVTDEDEISSLRAVQAEDTPSKLRGLGERLVGVAGGALAGFGLGRITKERSSDAEERPLTAEHIPSGQIDHTNPEFGAAVPTLPPTLSFSSIDSQDYEPVEISSGPTVPLLPKRSSRRLVDLSQDDDGATLPIPVDSEPNLTHTSDNRSDRDYIEPRVYGGGKGAHGIPTLVFGDDERHTGSQASQDVTRGPRDSDLLPVTKPLQVRKPMLDEGSQTIVSGQEIDAMMRDKSNIIAELDGGSSPSKRLDNIPASIRNRGFVLAPPLPVDKDEKIAAAAKTPAPVNVPGVMGPPLLPASAYKLKRPTTPGEQSVRVGSRDGTTPRPIRASVLDSSQSGRLSRKSSVSSFETEMDERFNIGNGQFMYPADIAPSTDPRMIQAITQTMIGEYLWKYTRKAGRTETSSTRHRRFFWVHPYTRTLYWSEQDPSTTRKGMMKAKSVQIEAVRVVPDANVSPPGLHRKSIVLVSKAREIVITAPTSQRHETWFNALSYLLLRGNGNEGDDTFNDDDLMEFNPSGFSFRRTVSKMTRGRSRSRASLRSYNSRMTRTMSPTKQQTLAVEHNPQRSQSNAPAAGGSISSRRESSRFSTMASRFGPSDMVRGSVRSQARAGSALSNRSDGQVYNASSMGGDSAEDLRQMIERQDRNADELENVRACCDGKHDVGSLPRTGKHTSIRSRLSGTHSHHHHHHYHHAPTSRSESRAESTTASIS